MIDDVETRMFDLLKMPNKAVLPDAIFLIKQAAWTTDIKESTLNELINAFEHHIFVDLFERIQ